MIKQDKLNPYFVIIILGLFIYFPILKNDFLDFWDDQWVVMNHYTEGGLNYSNLWKTLTEFYHGQYAPMNELLYILLFEIFGYNSVIFHFTSIIIHILNSILIYEVIKKILLLSDIVNPELPQQISFLTAVLFIIHPLNVESVAWMSASKVLVYAFFYLLSSLFFLEYIIRGSIIAYIISIILFIFSFLGKEQAVTFPIWLLLLYWLINNKKVNINIFFKICPFIFLSIIFGFVTMLSQSAAGQGVLTDEATYPLVNRFIFGCFAFVEYIIKAILPYKLSYLYPFPNKIGEQVPLWIVIYPIMITISVVTLHKYLTKRIIAFSLLLFLIHIGITLHIVPLSRYIIIADRYIYISLIGILLIISYIIMNLLSITENKRKRQIITTIIICYIFVLGNISNSRTKVWENTSTLKKELRFILSKKQSYEKIINSS